MACEHIKKGVCLVLQGLGIGSDNYQVACDHICKGDPANLREYFGNNKKLTKEEQEEKNAKTEAERQALLAELPGPIRLMLNFEKHMLIVAKYKLQTGRILISDEWAAARLAVCEACPSNKCVRDDNGVLRCVLPECGCHLDNPNGRVIEGKTKFEALHCDLKHWEAVDRYYKDLLGIA